MFNRNGDLLLTANAEEQTRSLCLPVCWVRTTCMDLTQGNTGYECLPPLSQCSPVVLLLQAFPPCQCSTIGCDKTQHIQARSVTTLSAWINSCSLLLISARATSSGSEHVIYVQNNCTVLEKKMWLICLLAFISITSPAHFALGPVCHTVF